MALLSAFALALAIVGCAGSETSADYGATASAETTVSTPDVSADSSSDSTETDSTTADSTAAAVFSEAMSVSYDSEDLDDTWDQSTAVGITLAGDTAKVFGAGAQVNGGKVTITAGGTYLISGSLDDGQIIVDTQDKETVRLVLNGADISCSTSAPIYVASANKTIIVLADGSENRLTDGESYILEDKESDEPNAAVFSKSDLTINGDGALTVTANYNNGIANKDDLKIVSGLITVEAVNDGLKGRDCIGIKGGTITITAGGDGMQSNNDEDPAKGTSPSKTATLTSPPRTTASRPRRPSWSAAVTSPSPPVVAVQAAALTPTPGGVRGRAGPPVPRRRSRPRPNPRAPRV